MPNSNRNHPRQPPAPGYYVQTVVYLQQIYVPEPGHNPGNPFAAQAPYDQNSDPFNSGAQNCQNEPHNIPDPPNRPAPTQIPDPDYGYFNNNITHTPHQSEEDISSSDPRPALPPPDYNTSFGQRPPLPTPDYNTSFGQRPPLPTPDYNTSLKSSLASPPEPANRPKRSPLPTIWENHLPTPSQPISRLVPSPAFSQSNRISPVLITPPSHTKRKKGRLSRLFGCGRSKK